MKSKNLIRLAFLLLIATNVCLAFSQNPDGDVHSPKPLGVISIMAHHYQEGAKLPSPLDSFYVTIDQFEYFPPANDKLIKRFAVHELVVGSYDFLPVSDGRFMIAVADKKGNQNVIEIIYSGGITVLTLIIPNHVCTK